MPQNNNIDPAAAVAPAVQQNSKDVAAFPADFSSAYDEAEKSRALDVMRSIDMPQNGVSDAPKDLKDPAGNDAADTVDTVNNAMNGMKDKTADPVSRAALGAGQDIALGVLQSPREITRGAIGGVNGMIKFVDGAMGYLPTITGLDEKGNSTLVPRVVTENTFKDRLNQNRVNDGKQPIDMTPQLPEPDAPKIPTVTGGAIEAVTKFAVGFKGADKLAKLGILGPQVGAWLQGSGVLPQTVKGALGDLLAFDQHEARLSNVVQQIPALQNPVTEYLQAKPDDGFAEGKFKQAVEGVGLGALTNTLIKGVTLLKDGLSERGTAAAAQEALKAGPAGAGAAAEQPGVSAENFSFLGDPNGEALLRKQQKLDAAAAEVQGAFGTPKQVPSTPSPSINDYEINFSRINGPDDIKNLMDEMVNKPELKIGIEATRRGTQTNADTLATAQDIDGFESLMQRRTGEAFNAEHIVAARKIYYDTTDKLLQAAKMASDPNAGAIDQFAFRKLLATHQAVQKEFMGVRAEAGRALQAWSIPLAGSRPQNLRALEDVLNTHGGADASRELAGKLAAVGDSLNTDQLNMIVQKSALARTGDALSEAWTLGLLTNPTTHVVNLGSNVMSSWLLGFERFGMAALPDSGVTMREGASFFRGMLESQRLALKNMAQSFRTGETGFGTGKIDLPRVRATAQDILDPEGKAGIFSKALDAWGAVLSKYAGGALSAADEYSKTVLYQAQTYALATRQGITQGLEGDALSNFVGEQLQNVPTSIRQDAAAFANYGTFTQQLGNGGQAVQKLVAAHPILRFVAPFIRTPGNIFKFSAERTPLALLSKGIRDDIAAGGVRKATALSRIGSGTTMMALGTDWALQGKITGSGPADPKTRAALRRTGWQPYSMKVGDTWYSYSRFEPIATLMGTAADMGEILSNYEGYDAQQQGHVDNLAAAAAIAIANQAVGKTFLKGFADTVEMFSDPGRYGEKYLQKYAGSLVPAGVADLARAADPAQHDVNNMIDAIRSRIPGASLLVPPRRNIWGEEIKYFYPDEKSLAGAAADRVISLFNPVYYTAEKDAPLDKWLLHNGFSIDMPEKTQDFNGVRIDLRDYPQAYSRLVELRGNGTKLLQYGNQTMKQFFDNLATEKDPYGRHVGFFMSFGNSYDEQQNFVSQVVRDYQAAAKTQVLTEFSSQLAGDINAGKRNAAALGQVRKSIQSGGQ